MYTVFCLQVLSIFSTVGLYLGVMRNSILHILRNSRYVIGALENFYDDDDDDDDDDDERHPVCRQVTLLLCFSSTAAFYSLPHPSGPNKTVLLLHKLLLKALPVTTLYP